MPKLQSITVSVISFWDQKQHPEFPHPESSQFTSKASPSSFDDGMDLLQSSLDSSLRSFSKADKILGRSPSVAVYIPSVSGARYFLKYTISPPHTEGEQYYFKLFMNEQHINSWGVNPRTKPRGLVMRALFQADSSWDYSANGKTIKNHGTEARSLYFAPNPAGQSAANDGGLIEVQVFRARGKRRKDPQPEPFKSQDRYGLTFPSAGLLDKPQDTRFYEWLLSDPKDSPFATFRFHYRSWDHLQSLQLIPTSHPRKMLPTSHSVGTLSEFLAKQNTTNRTELDEDLDERMVSTVHPDDHQQASVTDNSKTKLRSILKKANSIMKKGASSPQNVLTKRDPRLDGRKSEPIKKDSRKLHLPISTFNTGFFEESLDRPLPALPNSMHSRNLSNASTTSSNFSISPSLLSWVENGRTDSPVFFGTVQVGEMMGPNDKTPEESFNSTNHITQPLVDTPPPTGPGPKRSGILPPPEAIFAPQPATLHSSQEEQPDVPLVSKKVKPRTVFLIGTIEEEDPFMCNTVTPSESEWMNQHQAPPVGEDKSFAARMANQWSPKIDKGKKHKHKALSLGAENQSGWDSDVDADGDDEDSDEQLGYSPWSSQPQKVQRKKSKRMLLS